MHCKILWNGCFPVMHQVGCKSLTSVKVPDVHGCPGAVHACARPSEVGEFTHGDEFPFEMKSKQFPTNTDVLHSLVLIGLIEVDLTWKKHLPRNHMPIFLIVFTETEFIT